MSKLNLVNLSKDELTKEEAQKTRGGLYCDCLCTCACECPPREFVIYSREAQTVVKLEDRNWYVA